MARGLRRFLILFVFLLLLVYFSLNLIVNLDLVKQPFLSYVESELNRPVSAGYVYVNWRLHPTLSHLEINPPDHPDQTEDPRIRASWLEIIPTWGNLGSDFPEEPSGWVRLVRIERLNVYEPVEGSGETEDREASAADPPSESLDELLPRLPVRVDRFSYQRDDQPFVRGRNLTYQSPEEPVEFEITEVSGVDVASEGTLSLAPFRSRLRLESVDLSEFLPEYDDLTAEGQIDFSGGNSTLQFQFSGRIDGTGPGSDQLPARLEGEGQVSDGRIRLESVRTELSDASVDMAGEWTMGGGEWELRGEYRLEPGAVPFDRLGIPGTVELLEASAPEGRFRLEGSGADVEYGGNMDWENARIRHQLGDRTQEIDVKQLRAEYEQGRINFVRGTLTWNGLSATLSEGTWRPFATETPLRISGLLSGDGFPPWIQSLMPAPLGELRQVEVPFTYEVRQQGTSGEWSQAVNLESGRLQADRGEILIEELRWRRPAEGDPLQARFRDPGGNQWRLNGDPETTLHLRSTPGEVTWLTSGMRGLPEPVRSYASLGNAAVRIRLEDPLGEAFTPWGEVDFEQTRLEFGEERRAIANLNGTLTYEGNRLRLDNLRLEEFGGSLTVNGIVTDLVPYEDPALDLELEADSFRGDSVARAFDWPSREGDFDLTGTVRGTVDQPEVDLTASSQALNLGPYTVDQPRLRLRPSEDGIRWEILSGRVAGADASGNGRLDYDGDMSLEVQFEEGNPKGLFPGVDWAQQHLTGEYDADLNLTGILGKYESWEGTLRLSHQSVRMGRFPPIAGIGRVADLNQLEDEFLIRDADHEIPVREGKFQLDGLEFHTHQSALEGTGTVGLNGELNARGELILRGELLRVYLRDVLGEIYRQVGLSEERELTIPFDVRGTVSEPDVQVDREMVQEQMERDFVRSLFSEEFGRPILRILDTIF